MHTYEKLDIDVFISHHTSSSLPITTAIAHTLESRKIRCWFAPRDTTSQYAGEITRAIRAAKVFLLVLNSDASESFDVLNEFDLAAKRLRNREELTILSFKVEEAASLSDDMEYYAGRFHWIDAVTPPIQARIDELADKVERVLGRPISEPAASAQEIPEQRLISNMPDPRADFTGRETELAAIHAQLQDESNKLFLQGMGGIGKTELAKAYVRKYAQAYDARIFISYTDSLKTSLASDAQLKIDGMERGGTDHELYFSRKMELLEKLVTPRTLLLIDNFDVTEDPLLDRLLRMNCTILLTTRTDFSHEGLPVFPVNPLDNPRLLRDIFLNNCPIWKHRQDAAVLAAIDELIAMMNGHTMSIEILAKQLVSSRKSPQEMLDMLKGKGLHNLGLREKVRHSANKPAQIGFELLRELYKLESLTPEEQSLMSELIFLPLSGLDARLIHDWCELDSYELLDSLAQRSWIRHHPETDAFSLHPLVAEVVMGSRGNEFPKESKLLRHALNIIWSEDVLIGECKTSVALRLFELYPHATQENEAFLYHVARAFSTQGRNQSRTLQIFRQVWNIRRTKYPVTHNKIVEITMSLLEHLPASDPFWPELEQNSLALIKQLQQEQKYMLTVQLLISLGKKYIETERMNDAMQYVLLAQKHYKDIHLDKTESLDDIAVLYMRHPVLLEASLIHNLISKIHMKRGEYEEAYACEQRAWEVCQQALDLEYDLANDDVNQWLELNHQYFMAVQGLACVEMGRWDEAKQLLLLCEEILLKYRPPTRNSFRHIYDGLLCVYSHEGDDVNLRIYQKKLGEMLEANYAPEHPLRIKMTEKHLQ